MLSWAGRLEETIKSDKAREAAFWNRIYLNEPRCKEDIQILHYHFEESLPLS